MTIKTSARRKPSYAARKSWFGWIFVLPFLIGLFGFYGKIWVDSIIYSFSDLSIGANGIALSPNGFANYYYALRVSPAFTQELLASMKNLLFEVPTLLIFSLLVAVILNHKMRGRAFFRAVFFLPVVLGTGFIQKADQLTSMAASLSDTAGLDTGSSFGSGLLNLMDIEQYLANLNFGTEAIGFVLSLVNNIFNVVTMSGVQILIFLAGLQAISPSIYESAQIEGAGGWESFWKITLPMIGPIMLANALYSVIDSFTRTGNGLMALIDDTAFNNSKYGLAAAMSWTYALIIILFIGVVGLICWRFMKQQGGGRER